MSPRLVSCYFGHSSNDDWPRLARVLRFTADRHCAGWITQIARLSDTRSLAANASVDNTRKLEYWAMAVRQAPDGARLALLDTDTVILRSLDPIWSMDFDVAYTTRPASSPYPINAGVVFVRVSPIVREFFARWLAINALMLLDRAYHDPWARRYGGINQAALGALFEDSIAQSLYLRPVDCLEWNCEDLAWSRFDSTITRIVHVKTALRESVFGRLPVSSALRPLVDTWQALEREAAAVPA